MPAHTAAAKAALVCLVLMLGVWGHPARAQESLSGRALPRWATIASPEVNIRTGPGKRYPIDWILRKKYLPVETIQEFEHWRRIREPAGGNGWIHKSMLTSSRRVMIQRHKQPLFAKNTEDSRAVAVLEKGVIATLDACQTAWCHVTIQSYDGWVPKKALWGVYPNETFD